MRAFLLLLVCSVLGACTTQTQPSTPPATTNVPERKLPPKYDAAQDPAMNPPQTAQKEQAVVKPTAANGPVAVFRATPCYGTCPHYTATLYADGRLEYEGINHVALKGKHQFKLPAATLDHIILEANQLHFSQLRDQYLAGVTDLPSTYLTLTLADGTQKTVQAEPGTGTGAPAKLQGLLKYIGDAVLAATKS